MLDLTPLLDDPDTTIAVVGANDNPAKFGRLIYRDLKRKGFVTYPVNPNRATVDGDRCYSNVAEIDPPPTLVNFVVPPPVTLEVLKECLEAGLLNVWLQPGSQDATVMRFLEQKGFRFLSGACIMVETRVRTQQ